jgi:hypothetical protein
MVVLPSAVLAQGSITGVVRDTSGAVLPGVTVEASSPALIEKVRSVVTDGTGQYRIVDLRPGSYTFMLPGFSVVRREGIELTARFTATVNAEMRVGAVEETSFAQAEACALRRRNRGVASSLGVAAAASPAWAHHSFAAAYGADALVTVRGVIVEARLVNPHSRIVSRPVR